jgi:PAS domain-containing protein
MSHPQTGLILVKQLASSLTVPIFVVDGGGSLCFFNEPAEPFLGRRFGETDPMMLDEFLATVHATEDDGAPIKNEDRPLAVAFRERRPVHRRLRLRGFDGVSRLIEGIAFPLLSTEGNMLGAVGIFWGVGDE